MRFCPAASAPLLLPRCFCSAASAPLLLLMTLTLCCARPADAGTWLMHVSLTPGVTANGTAKAGAKSTSWTQPADAVNSITIASFARGTSSLTQSVSASAVLSVDVTMTWTPDTSLPSDPSPDKIVVLEQSTAQASSATDSGAQGGTHKTMAGIAKDGLGDPTDATGTSTGHHYVPYAVSGGKVSLTLALSASAGASPPPGGTNPDGTSYLGSCSASAGVGAVTISIHAQPYNFRRTYFSDQNPPTSVVSSAGELQFHYSWSSTSGVQSDLSNIEIHETVDAPSSPTTTINGTVCYLPPLPFNYGPPLHFDSAAVPGSSTKGIVDDHSWGDGTASLADCFVKPYKASSFSLTQNYTFYDPATMLAGGREFIPGTASGPWTITNAVVADTQSPSGYSFVVSKSGVTSSPVNLPN